MDAEFFLVRPPRLPSPRRRNVGRCVFGKSNAGGMASTAFLDRLSIRTDPARKVSEISFLTNEPQTGMILTAITLEIASLQPGAGTTPLGRDSRRLDAR